MHGMQEMDLLKIINIVVVGLTKKDATTKMFIMQDAML
jgi:hypothetical protein